MPKSRLNVGNLCTACFKNNPALRTIEEEGASNIMEIDEIAGIKISDIQQLPTLTTENLNEPITAGMMLKMFQDVMKPIHDKLNDHERRIISLEQASGSATTSINNIETNHKTHEQKMIAAETKIKNLEASQGKLKNIVIKQQTQISNSDKKERLRNIVLAGLSESEPLGENNATTDRDKVRHILDQLNLQHVQVNNCRRTGNKDQGPENRPRFLIVELANQEMRNDFKSAGPKLNNIEHLKNIRVKADLSKEERIKYKRI